MEVIVSKNRRLNPLAKWLALDWDKPEGSYNPDLRKLTEPQRRREDLTRTNAANTPVYQSSAPSRLCARDFLAGLLNYPKKQIVTEDKSGGGYPDIKLLTPDAIAWVVGDLKKDDVSLTTEGGRIQLWHEKRKYIEGLTRYLLSNARETPPSVKRDMKAFYGVGRDSAPKTLTPN